MWSKYHLSMFSINKRSFILEYMDVKIVEKQRLNFIFMYSLSNLCLVLGWDKIELILINFCML